MNKNLEQIEMFYKKYFLNNSSKTVTLKNLQELKKNISLETFLFYISEKDNFLLHGSTTKITEDVLKPKSNKIFATNNPSVAILKSLYSNIGVLLNYPYEISKNNPLILNIHTKKNSAYTCTEKGYIYIIKNDGNFENEPKKSWQFISKNKTEKIIFVIETEKSDFKYKVIYNDNLDEILKNKLIK